ncbi:putative C6 transcription factor [Aspergillus novofumigatus IBT 16806]|uniref:Putative C6 transcription factor n=1 Tax=Aspergillus novofumigatus (strain IBT 16806) TaxID=1392255 RepID=A0A2I1BV37_ASPN1|nr:putative C6 transcription factor [Aspergillus novofumigatus IBT 16806]PKX89235.1 putative C6 transcription factor [Aspergillus novofumigatus IBT 16806]
MDHSARSKRTSNAYVDHRPGRRCRARKVKCSGTQPCDKCRNRQQDCVFEEDRKIVVSEEYRKVSELEGSLTSTPSKRPRVVQSHASNSESISSKEAPQSVSEPCGLATPEQQELNRHDERFAANPLVSPSTYVKNSGRTQRAWLLLGPTSTWSFSRRVLSTIQTRLNPASTKPIPLAVDGDAYQIHWRQARSEEIPDISGLSSRDQAIYMLNTVRFHFGHLYQLIDEEDFARNLDEFYHNASAKVQESRLWYVQFLVVLAFGEALLAPVRRASNTASWTKYFSRAMSLLPDTTALWQDPLLAIEVLALIALYLHSVDMRDSAYCYIGHAMRMALVEGLHRALPVEQLGQKRVERCTKIWWTVYILDRKFSSLIGSPTSVNDEDVTTVLWDPKSCSQETAALSLHVKITQVITRADITTAVYSANGKLGGAFLHGIRSILHEMTDLSRELEEVFAHRFSSSVDALSGVTTRLTLSCHSCIIVTARPLILSLLWERLSCFQEGDVFRSLSSPVRTLIQACIDSALRSLKILTALRDQNLLESFLPFDLENLFSSFFILCLISAVLPGTLPDHSYRDMGFSLLDEMIARGNRVAQLRKSEIELLEELVQPLIRPENPHREEDAGNPLIESTNERSSVAQEQHHGLGPDAEGPAPTSAIPVTVAQEEELLFDWRDFGLSLNHMLSATDELNANRLVPGAEDEELPADLWLWGDG